MREIRTYGSEGGEVEPNRPSLPLSTTGGARTTGYRRAQQAAPLQQRARRAVPIQPDRNSLCLARL